jgi:hypothetical protein
MIFLDRVFINETETLYTNIINFYQIQNINDNKPTQLVLNVRL